jgi:prephenate dehydratase
MRVAIQGERGSFSHEAALRMMAEREVDAQVLFCALSAEVFARVGEGQADAAVIPIENSLAGSVLEHYDLLLANELKIRAELLLRIRHHLIAAEGVGLDQVREVYSHPIALAQCRVFFKEHPEAQAMPYYDTAGAAAHAVKTGGAVAGIASRHAADQYGGTVLLSEIEDNPQNYTRFLLLTPQTAGQWSGLEQAIAEAERANKVSLAFAVPNRSGSLVAALEIFARCGLNLTRLESRPVPGSPWQYVFYADYQLQTNESADTALRELDASCLFVKELGRYKSAEPPQL